MENSKQGGQVRYSDGSVYRVRTEALVNGKLPLTWWTVTPNFGDMLSPYLISRLTGGVEAESVFLPAIGLAKRLENVSPRKLPSSFLAVGSIISRSNAKSVVWGSGAFGTEIKHNLSPKATYTAVRGPLTRNLLRIYGIPCPEVYGDPALLIPLVYKPVVEKKYKVGIILRWSEHEWNSCEFDDDVKKIYLGTDDIEGTIADILSCEMILSSSLHGIILADTYGLPSAWLMSETPKGLEFKFYDYFISVNKLQKPQAFNFDGKRITLAKLNESITFNHDLIEFDPHKLLAACPFLERVS